MRSRLPLLALEYFVVTAREGTVRRAADKLHITPSAVSHQIARLEAHLNEALFHRYKRRLILTEAGKTYLESIEHSLDHINHATREIATQHQRKQLTFSTPPTFLTFWLLPRLPSLLQRYPDLDIRFVYGMSLDLSNDAIDCGVEYRLRPNKRLDSERLFDDEVIVVAAPAYIRRQRIRSLEDLRKCTLIETDKIPWSWNQVLRNHPWRHECASLTMPYTYTSLTAALLGQGVALVNRQNADYLIRQGQLAIPFEINDQFRDGPVYYFCSTRQKSATPMVRALRQWIFSRDLQTAPRPEPLRG